MQEGLFYLMSPKELTEILFGFTISFLVQL